VDRKHLELLSDIDNLYLWWNVGVPYEDYLNLTSNRVLFDSRENLSENLKDKPKMIQIQEKARFIKSVINGKEYSIIKEFMEDLDHFKTDKNSVEDANLSKIFDKISDDEFKKFLRRYSNKVFNKSQNFVPHLSPMNKNLIDFYKEKYGARGFSYRKLTLTTKERLLIGIGNPHIYEVGLSLHPLYGIPYIPGSELKGLSRSYYKLEKNLSDKTAELAKIFGDQSKKGSIEFLDAYLSGGQKDIFELDIMDPHYGDYYITKGEKVPADYLTPVPIFFLAISPGTKFETFVFSMGEEANEILEDVLKAMKKWFNKIGIGAKTTVGYGRMEVNNEA